ncbi:MAG: 23S rRNA (guanosine(2251)-2'-O)-methyltransferase RlmB [Bacteroidetes bacterium]|nr:23S rRNA (guanosine(2251)-2'-O)-methyltransferase RlmB [Bacteroidota bacterium]
MKDEIIYGIHPITEAINAGTPINRVYIQKDVHNDRLKELIHLMKDNAVPFQFVPREKLSRMTGQSHQGIVAQISYVEFQDIENVLPAIFESGKAPLLVILDNITDVRNMGAIARSAECFGIDAIIIPSKGGAAMNSEAVKASSGAIHKIPICRPINFIEGINYLIDSGVNLVACSEKAQKTIRDLDVSAPTCFVFGSEGDGINEQLMDMCTDHIKIPLKGKISSLNVSVAAGIIFYEAEMKRSL